MARFDTRRSLLVAMQTASQSAENLDFCSQCHHASHLGSNLAFIPPSDGFSWLPTEGKMTAAKA